LPPTFHLETELRQAGFARIAGIDEAGRGCLAGPVVAAAVILPENFDLLGVDDSKVLSAAIREELAVEIRCRAIAVSVGIASVAEIDELNILHATMEAMRRAASRLSPGPDYLLIDGNRCFPDPIWSFRTVVDGDALSASIAAASIIAKTTRDRMMRQLDAEYPGYAWCRNAGYATKAHYLALAEFGPTPHHRRSFRLSPRSSTEPNTVEAH
jgi:ribonuclease HII